MKSTKKFLENFRRNFDEACAKTLWGEVGMDKTQEEKSAKGYRDRLDAIPRVVYHLEEYWDGWQDCLEANGIGEEPRIPEGYFKIGERVQCRRGQYGWENGQVVAMSRFVTTDDVQNVRRIPAWEPKDGEAVFIKKGAGSIAVGRISRSNMAIDSNGEEYMVYLSEVKPFDASKIGLPWSEL